MDQKISIQRPVEEVFAYVADTAHIPHWVPQLRRDDGNLPGSGLTVDEGARTIRWDFDPPGEWRVAGKGESAVLHLHVDAAAALPSDPTEEETPQEALAHGMEAALQSLKSHLEGADGGDPEEPSNDAPSRLYGHSATQDPNL
ncbi:SRPBCC family protein [Roseomonas gilardii]|uniref:SRPBCC family protein n=1 Tax=Roseomonas gilardii TaxID=257708 RepID=A0A1L7AGZ2_9PROT|nr:SRPBCC family protein [Roseomonas gilardii]APT58066.1 hypothetical protein RGI145_14030 [Roseomonas gilardii]MDT8331833.1 SRPBCC family protein [Roseomonas gilardii]PZR15152.1 MAG: hypothetical protein DI532_07165 [Azospirillum brasilense]